MGTVPKKAPGTQSEVDWRIKVVDLASVNLGRVIRWGAVVWVAKYGYLSIAVLAGKTTAANVLIQFLANFKIQMAVSWGAAAGGLGWGLVERRLRKRTIRRLAPRIKQLERVIDSARTSSNLTVDGSTRPEDEEE